MENKAIVTVELTENNYSAYLDKLPGCVSTGKTFQELKNNMEEAIEFHLEGMNEDGEVVPYPFNSNYELVFKFDTQSLLTHYKGIFTTTALKRLTGINDRQLQRYVSGQSKPRPQQAEKIAKALHALGEELLIVEL